RRARGVVAIDRSVAVVVDAVAALLRGRNAAPRMTEAVRVEAVHAAVAVVVEAVLARRLGGRAPAALGGRRARGIVAVDEPVAVFVEARAAELDGQAHGADRRARAVAVHAVDPAVAVVVL